ncbi:MAG: archease [bacterium]|nr:archease [bacterium]
MTDNKCYEYIDHTADIGIRGFGKSFLEALVNVAKGMFAAIHDMKYVETAESHPIDISAGTREDLVVHFLNYLLYLHDAKTFIPKEYQLELPAPNRILGTLHGEKFNPEKHYIFDEIKAVTYHQLLIEQKDNEWIIQVICDL